ncbi:MAG: hypothetical protein AAFO76_03995 [Cyanobacteria bacterium J06607_15]
MKLLSLSVAIMCDAAPGNFQKAIATRGVLETYGIQVYFYQLLQQQNLLNFFAGNYASCDYVIWCCFGCQNEQGEEQVNFQVVHQQDNDYEQKSNWQRVQFGLTPHNLANYIKNPQGTLICGAMVGDRWVESILQAGYQAYIAPTTADLACNAETLFLTGFFYYLTMHGLDYYTGQKFTPPAAVECAAAMDRHYEGGTRLFHYYQ